MKHSRFLLSFLIAFTAISWAEPPEKTLYKVEMRDGTKLATDVYIPTEGGSAFPVLLERTPYNKDNFGKLAENFNKDGIVVVGQDVRGRHASEGHARPFVDDGWGEHQDGYDTVEWIRAQPWSNGKIATHGGSANGITQIQLAGAAPEGIVGQYIVVAPVSEYHNTFYQGGVFREALAAGWLKAAQWPDDNLGEVRSHPTYDEYWEVQNLEERANRVNWTTVHVAGWYDIFQQGSIDAFTTIQKRGGKIGRRNVYLLLGPWTHGVNNLKVGEVTFPDNGKTPDDWPGSGEWIRHWLLDQPLEKTPPPVLYYTMGELPDEGAPGNEWHCAESWPPSAKETKFFLSEDGALGRKKPKKSSLSYVYDPANPVPTTGGANLMVPAGMFDQRDFLADKKKDIRINSEERDDVLVFTTEPLTEPMEVTGRITAVLHVSTSATDTDFTAKLTDVYPDGRSMLITDGIRRLGFRDSDDDSNFKLAKPGKTYRLEVDLWSTSMVFNKGHRIRLAISSSNFPRFATNPNTGDLDWQSTTKKTADQTVFVGGRKASYLILPIVKSE